MTANNDHPAFPTIFSEEDKRLNSLRGMTLRDYYAGQVLAGMHSRDSYDAGQATPEQRARLAYLDADAMLKERDK